MLAFDIRMSGPAFYQMMARLEDSGSVEGWYEQQIVESQIIRERHYRILAIILPTLPVLDMGCGSAMTQLIEY